MTKNHIFTFMKVSCLNCTRDYEGKFCPECGQKAHTHRITLGSILHDIPHSVWHVDKGFVYTFVQLLKRPGHAIREFIDGRRVNHYAPFSYLFILSAASSLISHLKAFVFEKILDIHLRVNPDLPFFKAAQFFDKYPALAMCLFIPVLGFCTFVFNRESKYNYAENLVLNTYLVSQFNVFFIIQDLICMLMGIVAVWMVPMLTLFFVYTAVAYGQFFPKVNTVGSVIKRLMMYIVIIFTLLTGFSLTGFMTPWWGF